VAIVEKSTDAETVIGRFGRWQRTIASQAVVGWVFPRESSTTVGLKIYH